MAGHNKWSKVKHIKGAVDAKRGKLFSKLSREITVAARDGADTDLNPRLRQAMAAARAQNMPGDTIERALKKGTGELEGQAYEEALYEAYGPGGVAFLIEAVTDNRHRTAADLRHLLSKNHGTWADAGSVAYQFDRKGHIRLPVDAIDEDRLLAIVLEHGAEDLQQQGDEHVITTAHDKLFAIVQELKDRMLEPSTAELIYQPQNLIEVTEPAHARQVIRLYDLLDDYDDTQNVFANFELAASVVEELSTQHA